MTEAQAKEFVRKWSSAVARTWSTICGDARTATVGVPEAEKEFGHYVVVLKHDGVYLIRGRTELNRGDNFKFEDLVTTVDFPVSQLEEVARWIREAIVEARTKVRTAIKERDATLKSDFGFLKQDIAEWNLSSKSGEEL